MPDFFQKFLEYARNLLQNYVLTTDVKMVNGHKCFRIVATTNFHCETVSHQIANIRIGDLGGFIEKEENLLNDGSWVFDDSVIIGNAVLMNESTVECDSIVSDDAIVRHSYLHCSNVFGKSLLAKSIVQNSFVADMSQLYGCKIVESDISGCAMVGNDEKAWGGIYIHDSDIMDNVCVENHVQIKNSKLRGYAFARDGAIIKNANLC